MASVSDIPVLPAQSAKVPAPKVVKAAREFEALLLASILGPLERTFSAWPGQETPTGSEAYQSMGMQALSAALAQHGGLGIANIVAKSLSKSADSPSRQKI